MKRWISSLCLLLLTAGLADAGTRITLVSTCGGDAGADVLALAEAKLSQEPGIELVERREVERVLQEQKLWQRGLGGYDQALAVGKLLGVQVFASLEVLPNEKLALGLVCFDAVSGVRLADVTLAKAAPQTTAENVVEAVRAAFAKRNKAANQSRTVCLLAVRNADLPTALDSLCQSVGWLMMRRLVGRTSVTVLERERLKQINLERELPAATLVSDLLAALVIVELEVGTAPDGKGLKATAFLSDTTGARLGSVSTSCTGRDAVDLADRLMEALAGKLAVTNTGGAVDRRTEARRFGHEAEFLMDHADRERALMATEAALALDPADNAHQQRLASQLVCVAHYLLQPDLDGGLNSGFHSLNVPGTNLLRSLKLVERALQIREVEIGDYLRRLANVRSGHDAETRRLQTELQTYFRRILMNRVAAESAGVHDAGSFQRHTRSLLHRWLQDLRLYAEPSRDYVADSAAWINAWLVLAERYPLPNDAGASAGTLLIWPVAWLSCNDTLRPEDCALWRELYEKMERHPVALVQTYGQIGRLDLEHRAGRLTGEMANQRTQAILRRLEESPTSPLAYRAALDTIDVLDAAPEVRWNAICELLKVMLTRREVVGRVVTAATRTYVVRFDQHPAVFAGKVERLTGQSAAMAWQNLAAVQTVLDAPGYRLLDVEAKALVAQLALNRLTLSNQKMESTPSGPETLREARQLFVPWKQDWSWIAGVAVDTDIVYFIGLGGNRDERFIQLARLRLPNGPIEMLAKAPHPWGELMNRRARITSTCVGDGRVYVGTREDGIFVFSTDNRPPQHLTTSEGLPSDWVHSLAYLDGRLYAGLGNEEGFLIAWDPVAKHAEVLASSRRKDQRSPLDDRSPFTVTDQRSNPARRRILLNIAADSTHTGIWQFDVAKSTLSQLVHTKHASEWFGPIRQDRVLLTPVVPPWTASFFDLKANEIQRLCDAPQHQSPPFLWLRTWLWTGNHLGRISGDSQRCEAFPPLPNLDKRFAATDVISLDPVSGDSQVLITKATGVWLLTLPAKEKP